MKVFLLPLFILLTVTAFAQPVITYATPLAFCQGDSVVLHATGYTNVLWLPGGETTTSITVLDSNTYQFIANPGTPNASASNTVTTTVHPTPTEIVTGQYTICGGCAYVSAPPGFAYYLWDNGDTSRNTCCDGACGLYITNEFGCTGYSSGYSIFNWGTPSPLNVELQANKLVVTNSVSNWYAWSVNGVGIDNWHNNWYIPTENGNYSVSAQDFVGCTHHGSYNLTNVGVDEQAVQNTTVFPNPAQSSITLTNNGADVLWYTVFSSTGRLVISKQKSTDKGTEINLSGLENGIYLLQIEQNEYVSYQKIIKL